MKNELFGVGLVASQILNVLHRPMISLAMNLIRLFVFVIPGAWIGGYLFDAKGVFWGVALAFIRSGVLISLYVLSIARRISAQQDVTASVPASDVLSS
ncbi:MAG: hypothetical protein P8X89_17330 [Reinekea sp.]